MMQGGDRYTGACAMRIRDHGIFLAIGILLARIIAPASAAQPTAWTDSGRIDLDSMANLAGGLQSRAASSALLQWSASLSLVQRGMSLETGPRFQRGVSLKEGGRGG